MPIYATKIVHINKDHKDNQDPKCIFRVPEHLDLVKKVGGGAYGRVASFLNSQTGEKIAVKKVTSAFENLLDGKRILREVKLLGHFDHPNILRIDDMFPPETSDFDDVYIVSAVFDTDLHNVIHSKLNLDENHHRFFIYQLLRGLSYLHSGNVVHRDLKPANLLVNNNCDLKICDFGLAKVLTSSEKGDTFGNTDYVVTRFYRAPEVVLDASKYTKSIDIWAVGCILSECITRKPLFPGKDYKDQIVKIVNILGTPNSDELSWLPVDGVGRMFLAKFPHAEKVEWNSILPAASKEACDAIQAMLQFDPTKRVEVQDALPLPFFKLSSDEVEKVLKEDMRLHQVDWSFDDFDPTRALLQKYIYLECARFHPELLEPGCASMPSSLVQSAPPVAAASGGTRIADLGGRGPIASPGETEAEECAAPDERHHSAGSHESATIVT